MNLVFSRVSGRFHATLSKVVPKVLMLAALTAGDSVPQAHAQLQDGAVIISEFFDEIHLVDLASGTVTDVLDSSLSGSPYGQLIEALDPNSIAITSFNELHRYDVASQTTSLVAGLSFNPREITRDGSGNLIATGSSSVVRVDATTGAESPLFFGSFFGPGDVVVDDRGLIYVTEFFTGLGVIDPLAQSYRRIGNFSANQFAHLDIGPDGFLYLTSTFGGGFYRVDPRSGNWTLLAADASAVIDDLLVEAGGRLLFGGRHGATSGLFSLDPVSGMFDTLVDGNTFNNGFFTVLDVDLYEPGLRSSVPEPASLALLLTVCCAAFLARRRRRFTSDY